MNTQNILEQVRNEIELVADTYKDQSGREELRLLLNIEHDLIRLEIIQRRGMD